MHSRDISCTDYNLKQTSSHMLLRVSNCQTSLDDFILSLIHHIYTNVSQVVLNMGQNIMNNNRAVDQIRVSGCDQVSWPVFPDPYTSLDVSLPRRIHLKNFITIFSQLVLLWNVSLPVFTLILDFKNIKEV